VLAAVILSGGESRRMGSPKALIPYRGATFLQHLLGVARHPKVAPVLVVLGPHADQIRKEVALEPSSVVINHDWEKGQLSSIQAALRHLASTGETDGIMLLLVDHPLVSAALVEQLIAEFYRSGKPIVLPTFLGKPRNKTKISAFGNKGEDRAYLLPPLTGLFYQHNTVANGRT
jgi:molybdenum cofactor cytidylyltransferase